ncbi:MAG TPA: dihydrodipicolinate synthase family protein [Dongiaceae bacterium]|nr:dihydrodipicolinate synthase family protein [Dongiaceae bacterium]
MQLASPASGIYPMLYAFFDRNGRLDDAAIGRQIEAGIAAGVDGIAILGLASEAAKLSVEERHHLLEITAKTVGDRVPTAVTLVGQTVDEQIAFAAAAKAQGAAWIIAQPPLGGNLNEAELIAFFGRVADGVALPLAIQNAPAFMNQSLSSAGLVQLAQRHRNISIVKWEGPAIHIPSMIAETEGRLVVFNGRGGLELPDNIRAGCAGIIPATETIDLQVRIYQLLRRGTPEAEEEAEKIYAEILPLMVFLMQSIDVLLCYGKRLSARRLGFADVYDRDPCLMPSAAGMSALSRYARGLGPF